jgi:hypothetical protein
VVGSHQWPRTADDPERRSRGTPAPPMRLVSLTTPFDQQGWCHRRADESQTAESIELDGVAKWSGADQDMGEYRGIFPGRSACGTSPDFLFAEPLPYILGDCTTVNRVGCLFLDRKPLGKIGPDPIAVSADQQKGWRHRYLRESVI